MVIVLTRATKEESQTDVSWLTVVPFKGVARGSAHVSVHATSRLAQRFGKTEPESPVSTLKRKKSLSGCAVTKDLKSEDGNKPKPVTAAFAFVHISAAKSF